MSEPATPTTQPERDHDRRGRFRPGNAAAKGPRLDPAARLERRIREALLREGYSAAWADERVERFRSARAALAAARSMPPLDQLLARDRIERLECAVSDVLIEAALDRVATPEGNPIE